MTSQEFTPVTVLELELDRCGNKFGAGPCTAGAEVNTGTTQAGATATTAVLAAGASAVDGFFNGKALTLADARRGIVTGYVGATRRATIDRAWPRNLLTRSEEFDHADWTAISGVTVAADAIRAPNGTLSADALTGSGATAFSRMEQSVVLSPATAYSVSCYLKQGSALQSKLGLHDPILASFAGSVDVTWSDGVPSVAASFAATAISLDDRGQGWWRLSFQATTTANANHDFLVYPDRNGTGLDTYAWGAQLDPAAVLGEYMETAAAAAGLPDLVDYRVLEVGAECYNTFRSCQDTPNFLLESEVLRFAGRGAPLPHGRQIRPTITAKDFAPTEIDLEKGLGPRGSVSITLQDEAAPDVGADPYIATRPVKAGGTYWIRLLARNHNTAGRPARLRRAKLTGPWDDAAFSEELYIIDAIAPPSSRGTVKITLKDPIKLTDRRLLPEPSLGKLALALTADALSLTLGPGQGADYPAPGIVRVGKEIIKFTAEANDVLSLPNLSHRGQFATEAKAASLGGAVQLCRVWENVPVTTVITDLVAASGFAAESIDFAGIATEESDWLGPPFNVTVVLSAPEQVSKLLADLVSLVRGYMWWAPRQQQARFKVFAPLPPNAIVPLLTDAANIIEGSVRVEPLVKLRTTVRALYFDPVSATADLSEPANLLRGAVKADLTAESAREYGDRIAVKRTARWWTAANDIAGRAVVSRAGGYYRDAPDRITVKVSAKDDEIDVGDQVDLEIQQIAGFDGRPLRTRCLVTRRDDQGDQIELRLRTTKFGPRYGFIGPNGIGDYPNDPEYAHIAPDANGFSDGTGSYLIF